MGTPGSSLTSAPGRLLAVSPVNHPGGAETTLLRLTRGLAAQGWQITLSTPGDGPLADAALGAGHAWQPLATGGIGRHEGAAAALAGWAALRRRAADVDVVYLNGGVSGRLLVGLLGSPVVSVLHLHDMVERAPRFWRLADLVLTASEALARRLGGLDPQLDPLVVGVPVDLDPPAATAPWRVDCGPVVGFVGRPEPRKGVHDLLAAVPLLRAAVADVAFVLVGDDPYRGAPDYTAGLLAEAAALGVQHVPWHDNAPGLMRHMDVLVLPSYSEPFGTVLAEAMAVGTPVVATAIDGLIEVVQDGVSGRLVPPGDPPALAAAVLEVLSRREAMSAAAVERAQRWSAPAYVDRISASLSARIGTAR